MYSNAPFSIYVKQRLGQRNRQLSFFMSLIDADEVILCEDYFLHKNKLPYASANGEKTKIYQSCSQEDFMTDCQ